MFSIVAVVGTRPEIIKMAPIILEAEIRGIDLLVLHTGQHYDDEMSNQIFASLRLPEPFKNLDIQSVLPHEQLSEMIDRLGDELVSIMPNVVLAVGDTVSVLASCLASIKNKIPFGHIEAGLRSFDNTMPEEINRKIVDSISSLLFAPSQQAVLNLLNEGLDPDRIFFTGNTFVDSLKIYSQTALDNQTLQADQILQEIKDDFIICTIHRDFNVDDEERLREILMSLTKFKELPILFLLHPRTAKKIEEYNMDDTLNQIENLCMSKSIDYLSMLKLIQNERCRLILTDSGGLQEEAAILKKPCITIRPNTERPETVVSGINFLVETDSNMITKKIHEVLQRDSFEKNFEMFASPYGDGFAGKKILDLIENNLDVLDFESPRLFDYGSKSFFLIEIKRNTKKSIVEEKFHCQITMVYDELGQPIPIPEELKKGYRVRVTIR